MARYFFHYIDSVDVILDPEGIEISLDQVPANALRQARSMISGDALDGAIDLTHRIEVKDEGGGMVHRIVFKDAVVVKA